jgi:alkaline phosphatase D
MKISRREALRLAAAVGVAPTVLAMGCDDGDDVDSPVGGMGGGIGGEGGVGGEGGMGGEGGVPDDGLERYEYDGDPGPETLFQHGIASGDPLTDAVILWTHASTPDDADVEIFYEIGETPDLAIRVAVGRIMATADQDFTAKIDVTGLEAGTTYYYRFWALGRASQIGRTRTLPEGGIDRVRLAVTSCSSLAHGYFHVYRHLSEADVDVVVHLGDYIYEYASGGYGSVREYDPPHEIVTLEDYRRRYAHYRKDLDLQALHQQHPMINIWDDHETANDAVSEGAENHEPEEEGEWSTRRAAGTQAWFEWLPVRVIDGERIWRNFQFGDLVNLIMLDTRLWGRVEQVTGATAQVDRRLEGRALLGQDQEMWLAEQLTESGTQWSLLGQQIMMGQLKLLGRPLEEGGGTVVNMDQWDGYTDARDRVYALMERDDVDNVVVLTGDIHTSWAIDITPDPNNPDAYDPMTGAGALAVEFVTPAVTSPGLAAVTPALVNLLESNNPHIHFAEVTLRGYVILDVTAEKTQADWYLLPTIEEPEFQPADFVVGYATLDGENRLMEMDTPTAARMDAPEMAPTDA